MLMQVKLQKKETEAQAKRRLSSYAHIQKQEIDEGWRILTPHQSNAPITQHVFDSMTREPTR